MKTAPDSLSTSESSTAAYKKLSNYIASSFHSRMEQYTTLGYSFHNVIIINYDYTSHPHTPPYFLHTILIQPVLPADNHVLMLQQKQFMNTAVDYIRLYTVFTILKNHLVVCCHTKG